MIQDVVSFLKNKSFDEVLLLKDSPYFFDVKVDNNMYMLSYTEKTDLSDPMMRYFNGLVFEIGTNKLLHYCFPKTYEGFEEDNVVDSYSGPVENYTVQHCIEGSIIKLFYYNDQWNVSTMRNINASLSHWGNEKSFKELFLETAKTKENYINFSLLDKNFCYTYILQHPHVKLPVDISSPSLTPLNIVNLETYKVYDLTEGFICNKTIEEVRNENEYTRNYIVNLPGDRRVKLMSKEYRLVQNLLDNNPSIKWCYLDCLKNNTSDVLKKYYQSEMKKFNSIDTKIVDAVALIQNLYYRSYVKKEEIEIPHRYSKTLIQLHAIFRKTKQKTTKEVVYNHLMSLPTKTIYWILDL